MVCGTCHQTLAGSGRGLNVGATPEMLAEIAATEPGERPAATDACSWCSKSEPEVKKLIGRGGTALCNECVSLASDIMDAELGSGWR
jgi:hypothetical protein